VRSGADVKEEKKNASRKRSKMQRKLRKMTLFVARHLPSTGGFGSSEPCFHCLQLLKRVGIKKIVFIDSCGRVGKKKVRTHSTSHVCSGYKTLLRMNVTVNYCAGQRNWQLLLVERPRLQPKVPANVCAFRDFVDSLRI
jgi:hypothetical protein